jgi:hypothetical protein
MKPFVTLAIFATLAGIGSAATIVQTKNFSFVPNGNQAMTFDKFDTSLGTLESVTVTVNLNKTGGRFEIDNDSGSAGTLNLTHEVQGSLSTSLGATALLNTNDSFIGASGTLTASNSLLNQEVSATTGDNTTTFNATGLSDYVLFEPGNSSDSDTGTVSGDFQFKYEGTGTYTMTVNATQLVSVTGLGGLQQAFTVSNVSGDVTVTYNYSAVPEPVSPLLGGLGMLLLFRRRR